jgi:hypothetical protein
MIRIKISDITEAAKRKPNGYVDEVYAAASTLGGEYLWMELSEYERLLEKYSGKRIISMPSAAVQEGHGPGTELKKLLARVGIVSSPDCSCNAHAAEMDRQEQQAPGWCEANIDTIVGWLREQAHARGLPFLDAAGRMLVRRAIKLARRNTPPPEGQPEGVK